MQLDYPIGWQSDLAASKKKLKKLGEEYGLDECTLEVGVGSYTRGPFPRLVSLYARMGLHRYNLLQGAKFQLDRVEKYVLSMGSAAPTYGITLDAVDGSSLQSFQVKVSEDRDTHLDRGTVIMDTDLPEWPPKQNPFEKHYLVKDSELQDNDDWIRLYVELAVAKSPGAKAERAWAPEDLKILKVAMDVVDGLNAKKNVLFYIEYKDLRLGRYSHGIAIVRRSFDEDEGSLFLVGKTVSLESIPQVC
ncbi:unnamed protein product [Thlaspi arvense]|uniref:Uncharacterized protein n=1 Tax=Thlaspi arvense TaxID=13288 RepID=A0AAU9SFG3_THLAR|nr:unnamed protein product [Thlaspi arvense]